MMTALRRFAALSIIFACLLPLRAAIAQSDRLLAVVSDLHVGAGHTASGAWAPIEDFRWQTEFNAFLRYLQDEGKPVDLVFAGDVFELWQSPTMQCSGDPARPGCSISDCRESNTDFGCGEDEAVARLRYVLGQHQDFLDAVRSFAASGNRVYFIPGNHDAALLFPKVRSYLGSVLPGPNVRISTEGYWLSDDGRVFADHGHQFDLVNRFKGWPNPFVDDHGVTRINRPWGENMVQQFYDQYEYLYPVVDNISNEADAIALLSRESTVWQSADAASKFFKMMLFEESANQAVDFLGDPHDLPICLEKPTCAVPWDYDRIRKQPTAFFADLMAPRADLYKPLMHSMAQGNIRFDPSQLTETQIDAICRAKYRLRKTAGGSVRQCTVMYGKLGWIAQGKPHPQQQLQVYLPPVLTRAAGERHYVASVYIYGHTHIARSPQPVDIHTKFGDSEVTFVNTGAFQRVAAIDTVNHILRDRRRQTPGFSAASLTPEDLPACYNYVLVRPYRERPDPKLMKWQGSPSGKFTFGEGTCL